MGKYTEILTEDKPDTFVEKASSGKYSAMLEQPDAPVETAQPTGGKYSAMINQPEEQTGGRYTQFLQQEQGGVIDKEEDIKSYQKAIPSLKAFGKEIAGSVAQLPRFLQATNVASGEDVVSNIIRGLDVDEDFAKKAKVVANVVSSFGSGLSALGAQVSRAESIPMVKEFNDKLEEFAVNQIKGSEEIRNKFTEEKEPITKLIREGRGKDVGNKVAEMAIFEAPRLALQSLLAYFSGGASLGYMGASAASRKYGSLADENITPQQRVINSIGTGVVEFFSEKLGTGRVLDKVFSGQMKKGVANKIKEFLFDAIGGATSEGVAQVGENFLDQAVGMDADLGDGVAEALIMGALFDGGTSVSGMINQSRKTDRIESGLKASGATDQEVIDIIDFSKNANSEEELNEVDKNIQEILNRNRGENNSEVGQALAISRAKEILSNDSLSENDIEELNEITGEIPATDAFEIQQALKRKQQEVDNATDTKVGTAEAQAVETEKVVQQKEQPVIDTDQKVVGETEKEQVDETDTKAKEDKQEGQPKEESKEEQAEPVEPPPIPKKEDQIKTEDTERVDEGVKDSDSVGVSRRMRKIQNDQNDIDNTPLPEREEQSKLLDDAMESDIKTDVLIDELSSKPRVMEDIEVAALTIRSAEIVDEIEYLKRQLDSATETEKSAIEERIGIQLEYLDKIERGVSASGTKMGRALAAMNIRLKKGTYDIATAISYARKNKGAPLTKKESARVSDGVTKVRDQEDKIDGMMYEKDSDMFMATTEKEMADKANDYLEHLEKAVRDINDGPKPKEQTKIDNQEAQLKELIRQQDIVIDLINQIEGRGKKRPTKKGEKISDPEGYIAMAKNLRNEIKKSKEYSRFLDKQRQKEKTLDDKITQTTENIEEVKRTVEDKTKSKPLSVKQKALNKLKGIERDQDNVIELQNIFNEQIMKVSDPKVVNDPEGLKAMAKNLRKMIVDSQWYKDAKKNPSKDTKMRIKNLDEQLKSLEAQMDGMYRELKMGKKIEEPAIEVLKDRIKFTREQMRLQDELASVNEDIRLISEGRYDEVSEIKRRNKKTKLMKGLDKERAELQMRKDTLNQSINELSRNGAGKVAMDVADFLRAMKLSLDTWIGRQGAKALMSDPKTALTAFGESMKGSLSDSKFYEASKQIQNDPTTKHGRQHGLEIMEVGGTFELHQEAMNSKLAEKFPFVRWSNRNMVLGINALRSKMYKKMYNRFPNESDAFYEASATFINEWTGRGSLGKLEKGAHGLSALFTAPRWVTSNWQVLASERHAFLKNPETGKKEVNPKLLKEIATQKAKAALGFGIVSSMMIAMGFEFEDDPEEGDFMKLRKGDLVIDIMPGLSSNLRLLGVLAESMGERFGVGELEGRMSYTDIADRYLSYKWAPIVGASRELITGETAIGDEREMWETVMLSTVPIMLESIYQDYLKDGEELSDVMISQGIQWFGTGSALYGDK